MSLSTLRNNFYRIATLIIDHGADVMRSLLDHFIKKNYNVSLKDFVSNHQHELYHQFNNDKCCQCSTHYQRPYKQVISSWQMDTLFEKNSQKNSCHKPSSKCEYCCSNVKQNLQIKDLDITLLKIFLVTYFEEEFWQNCLTDWLSFHNFLNNHKHDIFHLVQLNVPCCLCINNPDYTLMVATSKDRLTKIQWEAMFGTTDRQSAHSDSCVADKNPCSVSATKVINQSSLNGRARMTILSKFCTMMKHIDELVHARNTVFAHAIKGEVSDDDFRKLWEKIANSILYLSEITNTDPERTQCILELRELSPNEGIFLEMQYLALRHMQKDEQVIQESRNIQQTVESLAEMNNVKLLEIQLQITNLKPQRTYTLENNLSSYAEYTDGSEYAHENSAKKRCSLEYEDGSEYAHENSAKKRCSLEYEDGNEYAHENSAKKRCSLGYKGCNLICCTLLFALPIAMLIIGGTNSKACPAEKHISIYLVVAGLTAFFGIIANCYNFGTTVDDYIGIMNKQQKFKVNPLMWILNSFLLGWFIAGNIWVYRTHGNFSSDAAHKDYCNPTLYWFSFWVITSVNILIVVWTIFCAIRCIACHKYD